MSIYIGLYFGIYIGTGKKKFYLCLLPMLGQECREARSRSEHCRHISN
jgi:hypothetical protein